MIIFNPWLLLLMGTVNVGTLVLIYVQLDKKLDLIRRDIQDSKQAVKEPVKGKK
jgi:hypothetical protein